MDLKRFRIALFTERYQTYTYCYVTLGCFLVRYLLLLKKTNLTSLAMFGSTTTLLLFGALYVLICWRLADAAKARHISPVGVFMLSFLLTPLLGLLIITVVPKKN
jgi:hypothetical protein